jgi:ribosomal protein L16 Arg81 hydroxylase
MVNLFKEIKDEIVSFERYQNRQLIAIERFNTAISWHANDKLTYGEWLSNLQAFSSVKVEGLEDNKKLVKYFSDIKIKDIHLFYNPKTSYSFNWHYDCEDVYLFVVKGFKIVKVKNKTHRLTAGQGVRIPKGHLHKVLSKKGTWALSVGSK